MKRITAALCALAYSVSVCLTAAWIATQLVYPAQAQFTGPIYCSAMALNASISTATTTSLIAVPSGTSRIFICGWTFTGGSTASAMTAQLEYGTGAACSGPTVLTPAVSVPASTVQADNSSNWRGMIVPSANGLCVVTAGTTTALGVMVFYALQ